MSINSNTLDKISLYKLQNLKIKHATLVAFFVFSIFASAIPVSAGSSSVVINEINSAVSGDDWVELYNPTDAPVNVADWTVYDGGGTKRTSAVFSAKIIPAKGFIVVPMNSNLLQNDGDSITVYAGVDNTKPVVDSVSYPSTFVVPLPTADKTASRKFDGSVEWVLQAATKGTSNASQASFESIPGTVGQTTTKVLPNNLANTWNTWTYHDDIKDSNDPINAANPNPTANHDIVENPDASSPNQSVVRLNSDSTEKFNLATLLWSGKKLKDLAGFQFDVNTNNASGAYVNIDVNFNSWGANKWANQDQAYNHGRLVHVPSLTPNVWSTHDPINNNDQWSWSQYYNNGGVWPDGNKNEFRTWTDITSSFPNAYISSTLKQFFLASIPYQQNKPVPFLPFGGIGLRADNNTTVHFDNVVLATVDSNILYDFALTTDNEPTTSEPTGQSNTSGDNSSSNSGTSIPTTTINVPSLFTTFSTILGDGFIGATPIPESNEPIPTEDEDGDILGAQNSFAQNAAQASDDEPFSLFGINWYWLLSGLVGTGLLWWLLLALKRRSSHNQA